MYFIYLQAAYFVSLFPYLLLTILLGQAVTLDGAVEGIKFYMYPQWELLADAKVSLSLSLCGCVFVCMCA